MLRWMKRIACCLLLLIFVSLVLGFSYEQVAAMWADKNYPPPGQFINVSDHQLHVLAKGSGSPTVIFESGLGIDGHLSWYKVQNEIAALTQTVSYDRAGVMWSERGSNAKTAKDISAELTLMLRNVGFEPPYILVGHSLAGLVSRPFIIENADNMAGVVYVDVSHPHQYEATPEELQGEGPPPAFVLSMLRVFGGMRYLITSGPLPTDDPDDLFASTVPHMIHRSKGVFDESMRTETIAAEVQSLKSFGDIPLVIITGASPIRNENMNASQETKDFMTNKFQEFQKDLLTLSTSSTQVLATKSEHYVQISEPELVIGSIRKLIQNWRDNPKTL